MITFYYRTLKEPRLKTLKEFRVGSWIHVYQPTPEELNAISKMLQIDKGLLEDAIDPFEVPRIEKENDVVFVFTRVPYSSESGIAITPVLIAVGDSYLLTVTQKKIGFIDKFTSGEADFLTTQKVKLFLQMFIEITQTYRSFLININRRVRSRSVDLETVSDEDIKQFVVFESTLNDFLDAIVPMGAILKAIVLGRFFNFYKEDEYLVEDIRLAMEELIEVGKANLKTIQNIRNAYSTIMTNNLNRVIKFLTSLTIVLTIPTMIASLYGMNVSLPLEKHPMAFWFITASTVLISIIVLAIFIKKKWL